MGYSTVVWILHEIGEDVVTSHCDLKSHHRVKSIECLYKYAEPVVEGPDGGLRAIGHP